jgi:hypothetical protein
VRDLAGAHREPGEYDVLTEREMIEQRLQIGRERVVVITARGLAGLAEPPAVIADAAISVLEQHPLLALPGVAVERISVDQDDRLAGAMVVVVDLNVSTVFASDLYERHLWWSFLMNVT